jgi:hypothetical protein
MPLTSIIILAAIVVAFVLFAAVLAWGDYQTRDLGRADKPASRPVSPQGTRPDAAVKKRALINS